jgi:hypothetical protein
MAAGAFQKFIVTGSRDVGSFAMQFLDSESTVEIVETGSGGWEFPSGLRARDSRRIAP